MRTNTIRKRTKLPSHVLDLFWEYHKQTLSWSKDADLITRKVLESGNWDSVKWLLVTAGRRWLKEWLVQHQGAGLDPKRLRFWQHILDLPQRLVDGWIATITANPWEQRWHQ